MGLVDMSRQTRMLARDEERALLERWRRRGDAAARDALIRAHRPMVLKLASRYRSFGLPLDDLVQEGFIGLMEAANRFDLSRDVRFATYAHWWAKAAIQGFVLRNASAVRPVTSSRHKKTFFALKRLMAGMSPDGRLTTEQEQALAARIGLGRAAFDDMARRAAVVDVSLDAPIGAGGGTAVQDLLADDAPSPEERVAEVHDREARRRWLGAALERLDARERAIIVERHLVDDGVILAELGRRFGVSKERVRQIEKRALRKLHAAMTRAAEGPSGAA